MVMEGYHALDDEELEEDGEEDDVMVMKFVANE